MPAYTHAGASRCTTLSILEVQSLCDLLTLPPNLSPSSSFFHTSQYSKLTSTTQPLPPAILQPAGVFADIKKSLHLSLPIPTHLCLTHAGLNQEVIYSIYRTFEAEVVQHTKSLSRYADKHYDIPTSIKAWLNRMNAMTSLWYTPNEVYRYFPSTKNLLLLPYVESKCEACTLSIVGGRPDVLFDLRASLVSRNSTKDKKVPRLLRFVEAWVEGGEHVSVMKDTSSALGAEIKVVRREQKRAHRERTMRENKEVEKKNYGARDRGSGSRSDKMRNSMESPSSISALYAAETESHTTSTTSRREREDFLRSKDSRNPSQPPKQTFPPSAKFSDREAHPATSNDAKHELTDPVSPMSLTFDDDTPVYGPMRDEEIRTTPEVADFADVKSQPNDRYMVWSVEDEASRKNHLLERYRRQ